MNPNLQVEKEHQKEKDTKGESRMEKRKKSRKLDSVVTRVGFFKHHFLERYNSMFLLLFRE